MLSFLCLLTKCVACFWARSPCEKTSSNLMRSICKQTRQNHQTEYIIKSRAVSQWKLCEFSQPSLTNTPSICWRRLKYTEAQRSGLSNSWRDVLMIVAIAQASPPLSLWLTTVLSMWSCRESISRSPTGCQVALASSARVSRRSSWSMELCSSWSRSKARSTWLCQPPTCPFKRSHRSLTSPVCLRIARANPRAFSSGVRSGGRDRREEEREQAGWERSKFLVDKTVQAL